MPVVPAREREGERGGWVLHLLHQPAVARDMHPHLVAVEAVDVLRQLGDDDEPTLNDVRRPAVPGAMRDLSTLSGVPTAPAARTTRRARTRKCDPSQVAHDDAAGPPALHLYPLDEAFRQHLGAVRDGQGDPGARGVELAGGSDSPRCSTRIRCSPGGLAGAPRLRPEALRTGAHPRGSGVESCLRPWGARPRRPRRARSSGAGRRRRSPTRRLPTGARTSSGRRKQTPFVSTVEPPTQAPWRTNMSASVLVCAPPSL